MNPWASFLGNRAAGHRQYSDSGYPSRREILGMLSAAGAGMELAPRSFGQAIGAGPHIIVRHRHIYPPKITAELVKRLPESDGQTALRTNWNPKCSLDRMDRCGVATAIGSLTSPGVWLGNNEEGPNAKSGPAAHLRVSPEAAGAPRRRRLCREKG